jgi:PAS domain S-box-containing protein
MREPTRSGEEQAFDVASLWRNSSELSLQPMIAVEGTTHIVRYLNPAFSRLVGKTKEELLGRPFAQAVPEGEENGCIALLDRVYRTGQPEMAEQEHSQTPPVFWSYSVWPIIGASELPVGVMIQVRDSTEMAVLRGQVVAMNQQLLLSDTRQHELRETAENANRLKDEFLATLSHELRTPLTAILGWADTLASPHLDTAIARRAVEIIRRKARVQVQMVDDLLDTSRIITGKLKLNVRPLDFATIILAAVDGLRPAAQAKEISLELQLDGADGQVVGDPDRLQQVAWNLISNAIKFTPNGGRVRVELAHIENHVEAMISDTGIGIAPEFLPSVFDRFRQADATSTRAFGGLGLGLSIVRQLVELHGGTVRADSKGVGFGSTFSISLPLVAISVADVEGATAHGADAPLTKVKCLPEMQGLRLLVVDDEADICDLLGIILEGCGAQVKTATSVAAAMKAMAEGTFDVLISDIGMPGEDGYSLIAQIRALGEARGGNIPAAALTAYAGKAERIRVLQSGFQIHLPKPVNPNELFAVVVNLAGRGKSLYKQD